MCIHLVEEQDWPAYLLMVTMLVAQPMWEMFQKQYRLYALTTMVIQYESDVILQCKIWLGV